MRSMSGPYPGAIFIEGDIPHPMKFVLNRPMASIVRENIRAIGLVFREARQSVSDFFSWIFPVQVGDLSLDAEHLMDVRKIKVIV